ncbi:MAG: ATP-binding protein [Sphingobacteriia bacterium]|jgi:PAS domain S-box-containing protein
MIESIQHAANYARSLIEASLDPLVTINTKGKITDFNNATVDITGIAKQDLVGTDFFHYFTNSKKANQVYQEVFDKGSVANFPLTLKHINGRLTEVLLNGSVYKDAEGNVLGVVLVARDVTEQNRISNELNASKVIAESATELAELARIKAEAATRIAEDSVIAKQQFLSNMSHEIRTPMNAIIGFTKFLQKTELSNKQSEYLKAIKVSGDALIVLINDILDLAKVDAGKMQFEQIPFNMKFSITELLQIFTPRIQEKNLAFTFNFDETIPQVLIGDSVRLNQIILNLISNAIKFTSSGSISLETIVQFQNAHKVTILFNIKDSGIGIPADKIEKIFDNFQQATDGTSRIYGGTGLGLAIVKQLVQGLGGVCTVVSENHIGSTFSFALDFIKTNQKIETEIDFIPLNTAAQNINVLVVEDILLNQLLMKTLLDDFGFQCDIAENGRIALEKMYDKVYDIILMDLQMPEMNGFETTHFIRKKLKLHLPIIALTADVTTTDLAKCKAVGMNDYLSKPVNDKLLYNKIISLVNKSTILDEVEDDKLSKINKTKCIDLTYLLQKTKANPVVMIEMISLYLQQTPLLVELMQSSLKSNDWEGLQSSAHKIIPSFLIMGINSDFEKKAIRIKNYANEMQQNTNIKDLVLEIELICLQACMELEEELRKLKNT